MESPLRGPSEVEPLRSLFAHELERRLLDGVRVGPGDTVLELASGAGALCMRLADRVRPGGRTICSDVRPDRVAAMQARVNELGIGDIHVQPLDMLGLDLADASVDGVLCRWGLMYAVPELVALREALRVLRPHRWIAVAAWAAPRDNPWISLIDEAIRAAGLSIPDDREATGRMFSLAAPGRLARLLADAGFQAVTVDAVPLEWAYASFADFWDEEGRIAGPFADFFASLPPTRTAMIQEDLRESMRPWSVDEGYRVPGVTLIAAGRRPGV